MKNLSRLTIAPLLLGAGIFVLPSTPQPAAPGPGNVIRAVQGFVQAIGDCDRDDLQEAMVEMPRRDGTAVNFDAHGHMVGGVDRARLPFQDIAADGSVIRAANESGAVDALIENWGKKELQTKTRMISILVQCPGAECSWASVEFERSFLRGEERVVVPMRATVLVRWTSNEPHWKVFLWHSSLAPTAAAKTVAKNKK